MADAYPAPLDVTDQVLARADAHPLKDQDIVVFTQGRHVKVRTEEHPKSTPDEPRYVATYSLAEATGKARVRHDGRPAVYGGVNKNMPFGVNREGEHHLVAIGGRLVAEEGHPDQDEHDYAELAMRARLRTAEQVARLDRGREEIGRLGRVKRLERDTPKLLEGPK